MKKSSIFATLISMVFAAHATILTFEGHGTNTQVPSDFGSHIAADGTGYNVSNGATPNVSLAWSFAGSDRPRWDFYDDVEWGGVAQMDRFTSGSDHTYDILFTPDAGYGVIVDSFVYDDYAIWKGGNTFTWTLYLDDANGTVVGSGTENTTDGQNLSVSIGMTNAYAGSVLLQLTPELDIDVPANDDSAIDDVSFTQMALPPDPDLEIIAAEWEPAGMVTGRFRLAWTSQAYKTYTVETAGDLSAGEWSPVVTNVPGQDVVTAYTNEVPPESRYEFYRVIEEGTNPPTGTWPGGAVKVLSWNIWSADANTVKIAEVVQISGADIVGFQELSSPANVVSALESATGEDWYLHSQSSGDTQIISRFPVVSGTGSGAVLQLAPGSTAWLFNVHLAPYPYQPYDLRDGILAQDEATVITAANSARGSQVDNLISAVNSSGALTSNVPVFLTGDFNEPSHLDWTTAAAAATARDYDLKVEWPASKKVVNAGFSDAFRTVRPDEVIDPAYTWTPGYPPPTVSANEVHDRIDFVYFGSGPGVTVTGGANISLDSAEVSTDIGVAGFPADHRAVLCTFHVPAY